MNIIPLGDQIIVRRFDDSTEQAGAHVGSRTSPEATDRGVVIAAGTGRLDSDGDLIPITVKAGDTVVFGSNERREGPMEHDQPCQPSKSKRSALP